jgi:transcriptional regulator with PAS, ATPase and Fis domain
LFGHRKGAFTGAINDKKGLFQEADGGTIFLDEVGSMSPMLQSRLLRVLQEREVRRVGDNVPVYVNVRVVAATNEPLEKRIKEGTFREDLYYRLNVIPISLPSLRERPDDIPLLVSHFLRDKIHARTGKPFQITRQSMDVLVAHHWPGNVRELENAIERACALCEDSVIRVTDLPPTFQQYFKESPSDTVFEVPSTPAESLAGPTQVLYPVAGAPIQTGQSAVDAISNRPLGPLKTFLREQELGYLNRALSYSAGDKEKAAELLGVSLATLYRKLSEDEDT